MGLQRQPATPGAPIGELEFDHHAVVGQGIVVDVARDPQHQQLGVEFGRRRVGQDPGGHPVTEGLDHGSKLFARGSEAVPASSSTGHPLDHTVALQPPQPVG